MLWENMQAQLPDMLNPYDLYRMIAAEDQKEASEENPLPGLYLAKTHPWLKGRKNAYKV